MGLFMNMKVSKTYYDDDGCVVRESQYVRNPGSNIIEFKPSSSFCKVFVNSMPSFSKETYYSYFFKLIHKMQRHSNIIITRTNGMVTTADIDNLCKYLDIKESAFRKFLTEAKKLRIIAGLMTTSGYGYVINPAYAYNGSGIDIMLFMIFEKDERFVDSLTKTQIAMFKTATGSNYMKNIEHNFPKIYNKLTRIH